ncbi:hypothetical protein SALBM217S_04755 [Streptomyces griseoloalbus]
MPVLPAGSRRAKPVEGRSRTAESPAAWKVEPSGAVISRVRVRDHSASSTTSAPALTASRATAIPYAPSPAACTAPIADAPGSQPSTSATGSSWSRPPNPAAARRS